MSRPALANCLLIMAYLPARCTGLSFALAEVSDIVRTLAVAMVTVHVDEAGRVAVPAVRVRVVPDLVPGKVVVPHPVEYVVYIVGSLTGSPKALPVGPPVDAAKPCVPKSL